ncbi:response regulator [Candidatus Nitronereus thalassa]|uniref:Response regulator n=1 Tax=Candidatus Nitronereus thalassa TaxID=3020898 RepID=A0ABU3K667_9BACT|nr:response regulator [Candidatus Nitronereus thalassa]MDT7041881.1 response regulator [Candidatus Nitronereus thalassa]
MDEGKLGSVILVVDDCRMTRRLLSMYLREAGYEVLMAENGLEALEQLGRESCAAVITDLNMPQMDGIELTQSLKEHPVYRDLPILMLTTQGEERERKSGLEAGVSVFLTKPISQELLLKELIRVVSSSSQTNPMPIA